jgi:hypothetical protein
MKLKIPTLVITGGSFLKMGSNYGANKGMTYKKYYVEKICKKCGSKYMGDKRSCYCSTKCKKEAQYDMRKVRTKKCSNCGKEFQTQQYIKLYCDDCFRKSRRKNAENMRKYNPNCNKELVSMDKKEVKMPKINMGNNWRDHFDSK